jgi:hypothetical protein
VRQVGRYFTAFRSVHSLRRWSFTLCTSRATSIGGYLDIPKAIFLSDFNSHHHCRGAGGPVPWRSCLGLNFDPDDPQQLEAFQGIELMPSNLFALINLGSNHADSDHSLLLADGLAAYRRPGPRRTRPTSTPDRRQWSEAYPGIVSCRIACFQRVTLSIFL